jgi:hypothetical protein
MFLFVAGGQTWFNPFDCASWVIRALDELGSLGAQFNQSLRKPPNCRKSLTNFNYIMLYRVDLA